MKPWENQSNEKCRRCGQRLVKMPTWGWACCVNPFCKNYPVRNFLTIDNFDGVSQ